VSECKNETTGDTAKLTYKLVASTGYECEGEANGISPEHWGYICAAIANKGPRETAQSVQEKWAKLLHYPEHVDTAAYPTLEDVITEVLGCVGCSECKPTAQGVPDGWQLVPKEPTREMFRAADKVDDAMFAGGSAHGASTE
jgi:hypothetical protein